MKPKFLIVMLLAFCFANADAQYKFATPSTVSVELSLAQTIIFKKVFDTDREAMIKNKVKKISFQNSRGAVQYVYDKLGRMIRFSILTPDSSGVVEEIKYDSNNNAAEFMYGSMDKGAVSGDPYYYTYDEKGRMQSCLTLANIMFNPAKFYTMIYPGESNVPSSIDYFKESGSAPPKLFSSEIKTDSQGRLESIKDKDGKEMIKAVYTDSGVDLIYLGEYPTRYIIQNNRVIKITDDFFGHTDFTYKENGLIENCTLTMKEDNTSKTFTFEYEYY